MVCKTCGEDKPERLFPRYSNDGRTRIKKRRPHCTECSNKRAIGYNTKARVNNKENIDRSVRNTKYKKLYGITIDDYDSMYEKQEGLCYICKEHNERLCVDHCHTTTKVRKLLCNKCNTALGLFREDTSILLNAIMYISEHGEDFEERE